MFYQYINGKCVEGKGKPFDVVSPATDEVIATLNAASVEQANEALEAAQEAFKTWSKISNDERIAWIYKLHDAFKEKSEKIADLLNEEIGTSLPESMGEVNYMLNMLKFFCEESRRVYGETIPDYGTKHGDVLHVVQRYPLGVTLGHISWNHPISLGGSKFAPALAAGCTCVLKPSSSTPLATLYLGSVAEEIGFPKGVLNFVSGPSATVGKALNESRIPQLIGLIGSTETGLKVMAEGASTIKRYSLELGGNAPAIVMPDADLKDAVSYIVDRKTQACGQGCSNINRIHVHKDIHDEFIKLLVDEVAKVKVGWGKNAGQVMGPQINVKRRDALFGLFEDATSKGGKILYGGKIPEGFKKGAFIMPTVIDNANKTMRVFSEEVFAPIFSIFTFSDIDEALEQANDTETGLASYLYSHDSRIIGKFAEELTFGLLFVNNPTCSTYYLPHIGIKQSGINCDASKYAFEDYFWKRRVSIAFNR